MRSTRASLLVKRLMPWMIAGFVVMAATGSLLFYADPIRTYFNIFFRLKVLFLLTAGLNAAGFHVMASRTLPQWDLDPTPPIRARLAGGLSLALWAAIVVTPRRIL
jgi:uncharacterized membrane protein YadS